MEQKHLPTSISMGNIVKFLILLITYYMGLDFMPGPVDLVSMSTNGAAKTCKPIFLPIYQQVKSKHSKWDQGTMQQRCAALLPRSSIRSVGMFLKKKVLPLLHKNCTSSPRQRKKTKKRKEWRLFNIVIAWCYTWTHFMPYLRLTPRNDSCSVLSCHMWQLGPHCFLTNCLIEVFNHFHEFFTDLELQKSSVA